MFLYHFNESDDIKRYLNELEGVRIAGDSIKVLKEHRERIIRQSILKSSVYSARIEGNPLTTSTYDKDGDESKHKIEIRNLLRLYHQLYRSEKYTDFNETVIKNIHAEVMKDLSWEKGYRQEAWAVYDDSGNVIHLAPPFMKVGRLMEEYFDYISNFPQHPAIKAAVAQFILEKIHPFADGNGRTGRLASALILKLNNYDLKGMLPFEEYTEEHRRDYYYALEPSADMTEFVEYFLKSLIITGREVIKKLYRPTAAGGLPERRQEILNIIGDHPRCSFDFLQRRFAAVNGKTLHYDLKKLTDSGLVTKLGATRGAVYQKSGDIEI